MGMDTIKPNFNNSAAALGPAAFRALQLAQGQLKRNRWPSLLFLGSRAISHILELPAGKDFMMDSESGLEAEGLSAYSANGFDEIDEMSLDEIDCAIIDHIDILGEIADYCTVRYAENAQDHDARSAGQLAQAVRNYLAMGMRIRHRDYNHDTKIINLLEVDPYVTARFIAEMAAPMAQCFKDHPFEEKLHNVRGTLLSSLSGKFNAAGTNGEAQRLIMDKLYESSDVLADICLDRASRKRGAAVEAEISFLCDNSVSYNWRQYEDKKKLAPTASCDLIRIIRRG